jgi:colicin import membrane protein
MIRAHENSIALKAGALSLLVHAVLLGLLLLSFNWKVVQPASIATVELWSELPNKPVIEQSKPVITPPEPEVEIKPEPKPEPEPEPKAEIQVKKEPPKPEKPKEEPKKVEVKKVEPKKPSPVQDDALKKLQQALLEEENKPDASPAPPGPASISAENRGEMDKYINMINNKIRRNVNEQLCGTGKPELEFSLSLAPTGDIIGLPRLLKGSGMPACDESVERAILLAQPLPVPPQADLFAQFRDLKLKFHPKGSN